MLPPVGTTSSGLPGERVLMGESTSERLGNVMSILGRGAIAPVQIIATAG